MRRVQYYNKVGGIMATSQGSVISYDDLNTWYTTFNNLCSFSNHISTLTKPADHSTALATNINNLHTKISSFRKDKFLGTHSAWWPKGTDVVVGEPIKASNLTAILGAVSNASKVKCKNTATNNKGKNSSTCPNGTHYVCTSSNIYDHDTGKVIGKSLTSYNRGTCQSGTDTQGYYSCGTTIDITHAQAKKTN